MVKVIYKKKGSKNITTTCSKARSPLSISHVMDRPNVKRSIRTSKAEELFSC